MSGNMCSKCDQLILTFIRFRPIAYGFRFDGKLI